jgi:hypothetical protein
MNIGISTGGKKKEMFELFCEFFTRSAFTWRATAPCDRYR